ncbi:MAG: major capsid protein [Acidobacteriia bacterium]|jgi:hypothetical protein|nr:major capsid protein [Terriglobia bacterium]
MPDISMVHVDQALTEVSIAYRNAQFVADQIFPRIPVTKQSNKYFIYSKDSFRILDDARRPGARANEIDWTLSTDTYFCEGHALAQAIPDELRANADQAIDVDVDTTETLTDLLYLQREIVVAAKATDPTVVTQNTTLSGTSQWSDFTNSDPIKAVEDQKTTIQKQVGQVPNSLLVSYPVFVALRNHPKIIERFKYAQVGIIQPDHLKSAFNVDSFLIGAAVKNTANEAAAEALDYVWGKNAILFCKPAAPGRRTVSLGYQFTWLFGANTDGFLVKRYRDESRTADIVEVQLYYDAKVVAANAAYLWLSAVA